ncbi:MAG: C25 family cysteine peptidase, partial [candidate division Zixibacteria bacterium]|nr:C25 family cysteine peptidase [candidate division Zixibacteria bacterium]
MRSLIIWVVGVLCLILLPAPTKASTTVSCNGKTVGEVAAVDDNSILQVKHLQFIVERGRVDSVSIIRSEPYLWEKKVNPQEDTPVTTFSGDDSHLFDFYGNELAGYLARERELNAPRVIESRTVISSKEVLTIVVNLAEIDSITDLVTGFESVILEFHGSEDLLVTRFTSSKQLLELAQVETEAGANRSIAATTLSSGTPEYLIVTGQALVDAFAPLAKWKTMKGLTAETVTMDEVLAMSTGIDDAEKLRNFLIDKYNSGTRYVLLGGDETVVPIRYAFAANTASMPTLDLLQICDLYFGDVNGVWDVDGDGVYGEPTQDSADFNAELLVGRLPLCTPEQVTAYVSKLIKYEQNPNNGDYAYLNKSLFIAADQMRDYSGVGEHVLLAQSLPPYVASDTTDLIEAPTGVADDPPYPLAGSSIAKLSEGWGILSLLIHGRIDGWVLRSNRYNQWPKSFILTATGVDDTHGFLPNIPSNGMPGLVYSIGCNNGAFDLDTPPFPSANPSVATAFLAKPNGGAVAFVGYSRWGWVSTSWQIEQAFLDYLYNVNNNPAEALRYAKLQSAYYRDECYGLNYSGDPEMRIWTDAPRSLSLLVPEALPDGASGLEVTVKA